MWRNLAASVGLLLVTWGVHAQAKPHTDFEQRIATELREKDGSLLDTFVAANSARERADHATAERLYAEVFAKAPTFFHAERRRCGELLQLNRRDEAMTLCRDAAQKEASAANLTAVAMVILGGAAQNKLAETELEEATSLLARAQDLDPQDEIVAQTQCQVAMLRRNLAELRSCSERLDRLAPNDAGTAWASWVLAMSDDRFDDAEEQVERARKNGGSPKMVQHMADETSNGRPWTDRAWYWAVRIVGGWLGLSLLLVLAGVVLSRLTLRTAERWTPESARRGAALRAVYRGVLVICSLLYYVSLPLVLAGVVATAGGLIYGMFALGYVSIKLGLLAILMMFATGAAIVKSLTWRPSDEAPGVHVDLASEPGLRTTLEEVAAQIGTRPVDRVYMTPDTNLAVFERKGGERCLVVGAAVLEGMPLDSFKAILAHEYGHFSNRDTAGGGFALSVRRSLLTFIIGLAESGQANAFNPAWWFARGFYNIFLRVSQGASRLQEILADRRAAEAYGGAAFASGLKHVLACDLRFEEHVNSAIGRALKAREPLTGLFTPLAERHPDAQELSQVLNRKPSPYDSHPAPCDRIRWVEHLQGAANDKSPSEQRAWDIFQNRARHEREVTLFVYQRLAESGVHPAALPAEH
jgi:Zn-dependent protease with chaperone function